MIPSRLDVQMACTHHWDIKPAEEGVEGWSEAVCRKCGATSSFCNTTYRADQDANWRNAVDRAAKYRENTGSERRRRPQPPEDNI